MEYSDHTQIPYGAWVSGVTGPPPRDQYQVQNTLSQLVSQVNKLTGDMDDLLSLVAFMRDNPDKNIADWARYEGVKKKFKEVI